MPRNHHPEIRKARHPMSDKDLGYYMDLARYMEQPRLPGVEKRFNAWISENSSNRLEWQQWQHLVEKTRRLQVDPMDTDAGWRTLRDSIGLKRQKTESSRSGKTVISRVRFVRKPFLMAIAAMVVLSLFFFALHVIRITIGF